MQSTLKSTLLIAAAVGLTALAGTQAAEAGGLRHLPYAPFLYAPSTDHDWNDDDSYSDESYRYGYRTGSAADDAVSTAAGIAHEVLGVDPDDVYDALDD